MARPIRIPGSGTGQSETWKPAIRLPARAICGMISGSHQTWKTSTITPALGLPRYSAMSVACFSVTTTERSAAYMGCRGSMPRVMPAFSASGSTSARPSSTVARASSSVCPLAGPQTITNTGAPRMAASSIARRLSAMRLRRSSAVGPENQPPRQRLETLRPSRRINADAFVASPSSLWRQAAMYGIPALAQLVTACSSDQGSAVIWLKLRRAFKRSCAMLMRYLRVLERLSCGVWPTLGP